MVRTYVRKRMFDNDYLAGTRILLLLYHIGIGFEHRIIIPMGHRGHRSKLKYWKTLIGIIWIITFVREETLTFL